MHIDYEIREEDYLSAQWAFFKYAFYRTALWLRVIWFLPLVPIACSFYYAWERGSWAGAIFPTLVLGLVIPLLLLQGWKRAYRKAVPLHGPISLYVDDDGWRFSNAFTSANLKWASFENYREDQKTVMLIHRGQNQVNFVAKRDLTNAQLDELRQILNRNITERTG
jgi:YcxB-like protein